MSRRLQQRIIQSKATFPATVVLALLLWTAGIQWPLTEEVPLEGWWGKLSLPTWCVEGANLLLCTFTLLMMAELNSAYSLVARRSMLHGIFFLLLWSATPSASHCTEANLLLCLLQAGTGYLLSSFQQRQASGPIFSLFLCVGLGSLVCSPVLWLVPLLYALTWFLQSLSIRSFFAGLLGMLCPYWVLFVYTFWTDRTCLFSTLFRTLSPTLLAGLADVSPTTWIIWGTTLLLFTGSLGYIMLHYGRYKIRIRLFMSFFLWWSFAIALLWIAYPSTNAVLLPSLFAGIGILTGHIFSFSATRFSNILFLAVLSALVILSIYNNLWMHW